MPAGPFKAVLNDVQREKRAVNQCQFYKSPTSGQKLNSSTPVMFAWNNDCFDPVPKYVNIALLSSQGQIFSWGDVDAAPGSFNASLDASWWHNANQVQLQVGISASDVPSFLSPFVAGPVFTALNSNPTTSSSSHSGTATATATTTVGLFDGGYVNVAKLNSKGLSKGSLAAAVLFPILIAFGAIAGYVWFARKREAHRRAEWAASVDNRMSTISENWQTMSYKDARPSMHSSRRTPRPSVHSRTMSMLGAAEMKERTTLYEQYSSQPFATEDESQLGPRARALSAAAAEGRPLSSLVNQKELPALPSGRIRSKSTATDGAFAAQKAASKIPYSRAPHSHTRTVSTTSNNPYANAMAQRDSFAVSDNEKPLPFPTGVPIPRPRMNSSARSTDGMSRSRVISRVSFADAPRPSVDRRRNGDTEKYGMRSSARENSTGDDFAVDFGDALPALALMRVKSGEGLDGFDSPGENTLTPTKDFLPASKKTEYFGGIPNPGMGGRTPDEMLKAYASAMAANEKTEEQQSGPGVAGNALAAVRRLTGFWRK